ncbi:MAG: hypothetical protein J6Y98_03490 [Bacteroidales bacterium]|nr:hypothetical protein [Bacteroidales bacterium]
MKHSVIFMTMLFLAVAGFAQSKKELHEMIVQKDAKIQELEKTIVELSDKNSQLESNINILRDKNLKLENELIKEKETSESQLATIKQLQKELAEAKEKAAKQPDYIITNPVTEEDSIVQFIQRYANAKSREELLTMVYKPEVCNKYIPEKFTKSDLKYEIKKENLKIPGSNYKVGDKFRVIGLFAWGKMNILQDFYIVKTSEGYKCDWIANKGYNEIKMSDYLNKKMTQPTTFRITITSVDDDDLLGNSYYTVSGNAGVLYVQKNSATGKRMKQLYKETDKDSGAYPQIMVEIKGTYKTDSYGDYDYYPIVNRIVKEDWFSE